MKDRNNQVVTAVVIVMLIGVGVFLARKRFSQGDDAPEPTRALVERKALPSAEAPIDVGPSPMPSRGDDDGYTKVVSGERYFAPTTESSGGGGGGGGGSASNKPLSEADCQAFLAHVQKLEARADPSAAKGSADPKAIATMTSMCKKGEISAKFARCAMTKKSTKDFLSCGGSEVKSAMKEAKAVIREFEKSGE